MDDYLEHRVQKLSLDRREFARLCMLELTKATELTGAFDRMTQEALDTAKKRLYEIAVDMAEALPSRITCDRVPDLFRTARMHYTRVPSLNDVSRAWENHMKPQQAQPTPKEHPRLERKTLEPYWARMRHLAAARTNPHLPKEARMKTFDPEHWMVEPLSKPPTKQEVAAMAKACTPQSLAWYMRNPDTPPNWGHWMKVYNIGGTEE